MQTAIFMLLVTAQRKNINVIFQRYSNLQEFQFLITLKIRKKR